MLSESCSGWHRPAPATCSPPPRDTAPVALLFTDGEAEVQVTPGHRPGWSGRNSWPGFLPAGPGPLSSPDTPAGSAAWAGWGGTWASRRPHWAHLPACPHFLLHQGPGNAPEITEEGMCWKRAPCLPPPSPGMLPLFSLPRGWLAGAGFMGLRWALGGRAEDSIHRAPHQPLSHCAPSQLPAGPSPSEMQIGACSHASQGEGRTPQQHGQ